MPMEPVSDSVLLVKVVPAFGALVSLIMYASPMLAVLAASRNNLIGDLNPLPFVIGVGNCFSWTAYGMVRHDPFLVSPNAPGMCLALFFVMSTYALAETRVRNMMRAVLVTEVSILAFLGVITVFATTSESQAIGIWGVTHLVTHLMYYSAPFSTALEVIRNRNSSTILLPMIIMNNLNSALWSMYGIAMGDIFIIIPNGTGLFLALAQGALLFIYPSTPMSKPLLDPQTHKDSAGTVALGTCGSRDLENGVAHRAPVLDVAGDRPPVSDEQCEGSDVKPLPVSHAPPGQQV
mmetsp:Transcript_2673/g.4569  ORF Transcript_2673/g.4569 Transcript_2673/m.4569 type:complete len:292 (-) Transcript_2673:1182-2057(-)|eukprot:CAMPEP_0119103990 /NCGR_PEP_ID=MMETSP1180-20130426/2319_1 /TAXON_ID=3052 ORGANISM="Chlamydomonas cf sp, Strain CCMP681" /NCGR_SAMPLE_ID=MMETSP1180 /ASSEMBLY_ACC=CAM_ASM_000741 /LENGTH=291 /DNA_ID=CAMNT_0007088633 /DNA_START=261 /DNA_END=1136 /DNA_ORIENTATION=-